MTSRPTASTLLLSARCIPADMLVICDLSAAEGAELDSMESDFFGGGVKLTTKRELSIKLSRAGCAVEDVRGEPLLVDGCKLAWSRCAWRLDGVPVQSIDHIIDLALAA